MIISPDGKKKCLRISRDNGFTLMEVLIAVSLSAIIVTIVAGALNVGRRAWEKGSEKMEEQLSERWLETVIRRQIGSFCSRQVNGRMAYPFIGGPQNMKFLSSASSDGGSGSTLFIASYKIEPVEGTSFYRLVLEEENYAANFVSLKRRFADGTTENKRRKEIVTDILSARFSYKNSASSQKSIWSDSWVDIEKNPSAVLIEITEANNKNIRLLIKIDQIHISEY